MILIIGGSGSGKSSYAEDYLSELSKGCKKYYIATMQVFDEEGRMKIEKHRNMRCGKGFHTIEQPTDIGAALNGMEMADPKERSALLECISNLTANEMFSGAQMRGSREVAEKIVNGIKQLDEELKHLVIVSNNVFEDGIQYDAMTMDYIRAMGMINERLAAMADQVIEVVVGIPVIVKEGN